MQRLIMLSLVLSCLAIHCTVKAQTKEYSDFSQMSAADYMSIKLPPLHVLLENAKNNPQVSFYNANKEQEERELKTIKRSWLKNLKILGNYNYGLTNTLQYGSDIQIDYPFTSRKQSWWNVGAAFSIPFDEIFNRRNRIKQQQTKISAIQYEVDRWYDDLSLKIIDAYTDASQHMAILKSASDAMVTAMAQYKISENDFINGKIDAPALSRQKTIESTAIREYEQTRAALNNALWKLEILSSTKIVN